jgi:hypothetical protein
MGIAVLVCHLLGALINGLIYRKYKLDTSKDTETLTQTPTNNILEDAMLSSIKSILIIGGYVALFFMLITFIK